MRDYLYNLAAGLAFGAMLYIFFGLSVIAASTAGCVSIILFSAKTALSHRNRLDIFYGAGALFFSAYGISDLLGGKEYLQGGVFLCIALFAFTECRRERKKQATLNG